MIAIFRRSDDKILEDIAELLEIFNDTIFNKKNGSYEYNEDLFQKIRLDIFKLSEEIRKGKYSFESRMRRRKQNNKQERIDIVSLLDRIAFVINERFMHTSEGKNVVLSRGENLIKVFGSIAVLDATSNINPQYMYQALNLDNIILLNRISVRKYSNVTVNICAEKGLPQSKTGIYSEPKAEGYLDTVIANYMSAIESILKPEDTLLVVTYKDMISILKDKCPFKNVEFIHYGSSEARGSNKYSSFNKAMVIGWFRKPRHYYNNIVASITDWDMYIPMSGSKQSDATHLEQMLVIDDLAQFFNRVRCRVAATADGDCAQTELYLFTGGRYNMEKSIKETLSEEMTDININSWHPTLTTELKKKRSKVSERSELLVNWMLTKDNEYDAISVSDILKHFGWSRSTLNKIINPERKEKDNYFTRMCDEENIIRYKEGTTIYFKLPSSEMFFPSINEPTIRKTNVLKFLKRNKLLEKMGHSSKAPAQGLQK